MSAKRIIVVAFLLLIVVGLAIGTKIFYLDRQANSISALQVDSFPKATVFLDDKEVGQTPFLNKDLKPGEYKLKLFVAGVTGTYFPWETKIKLTADGLTYVSANIGKNEQESGNQILWLEKLPNQASAELAIVSTPDQAGVKVDGQEKGKTPEILRDILVGDHDISIFYDGYSDQTIRANVVSGFRLNISSKLSQKSPTENQVMESTASASISIPASVSATVSKQHLAKPYIVVLETGLGFLRVRSGPSASATESARVKVGEEYPLLFESVGWDQIRVASVSGWVSDQYVQKVK